MDMDRTRLSWDRCLIVSKLQELSRCVNKCGEDCAVLKGLASVRSIPFLSFIEPIFAYLGISYLGKPLISIHSKKKCTTFKLV